jgi:hypothetical protein
VILLASLKWSFSVMPAKGAFGIVGLPSIVTMPSASAEDPLQAAHHAGAHALRLRSRSAIAFAPAVSPRIEECTASGARSASGVAVLRDLGVEVALGQLRAREHLGLAGEVRLPP